MAHRCQYIVIPKERYPEELRRMANVVLIRDVGEMTISVTNDAEEVVTELMRRRQLVVGQRLFYYDSASDLDEITFNESGFTGFRPGPGRA